MSLKAGEMQGQFNQTRESTNAMRFSLGPNVSASAANRRNSILSNFELAHLAGTEFSIPHSVSPAAVQTLDSHLCITIIISFPLIFIMIRILQRADSYGYLVPISLNGLVNMQIDTGQGIRLSGICSCRFNEAIPKRSALMRQ